MTENQKEFNGESIIILQMLVLFFVYNMAMNK